MKKKTDRYLCIHGHFYQPPRENPWADNIFVQKSAHPYHDWNERITRECYGPNTRSRLHGDNGHISKLVNNYELINFNFGPTLLKWLAKHNPWVYNQIIDADRYSIDRFGGHGNAMAQVYNHLIMPLASERDKITQVKWGLADFYHRFNRKAEGMWLAETAADSNTLAVLAREGIRYTILSPYQAHLTRPINSDTGSTAWKDVSGGNIDCTGAYRCFPTDDKNLFIDLFFYNGPLSKAIAYEKILASGEVFLKRIMDTYPHEPDTPALVSMATDGESYGHHFKFGEMALTWVLDMVNNGQDITLTNYGEFLEKFPPENEVKIIENSAWSCAHGIERWRSNCGCSVSQNAEWTQSWRTPLRSGLDWLNSHLSSVFEEKTKDLLKDCWEARNDYIYLLLKPDEHEKETFIQRHAIKPLSAEEIRLIFQLLESQQMALYMFTSCGWFFDDISGLEAIQILMYAKKAIELCSDFSKDDLEKGLAGFLAEAVCNNTKYKSGMDVYNKKVVPVKLDEVSLLANYAMVCAIDSSKVPEWLKALVKPGKAEKIDNKNATVFICETASQNPAHDNSGLSAVAIMTRNNELICVISDSNEYSKKILLTELDTVLPIKDDDTSITGFFQKHFKDPHIFSIKDLIPDIKGILVEMLSEEIKNRLYGSILNEKGPIENYLKTVSFAGEYVPDQLNDLFKILFINSLSELLKIPDNILIDFKDLENFLDLFNCEPEETIQENNDISFRDIIVKQHNVTLLFEEYLTGLIEKIENKNINIYLNNLVNSVNFINKNKVIFDWWKCQNLYNDLRTNTDFISRLDNESLSLFRQVENLLGFAGGN